MAYLRTRFLGGPRTLLDFAVLILRCLRHIAILCTTIVGQHLFPKLIKRTSLSMRSWQRQAGGLHRPFVNITTNRLFKETVLLPLSLTSENFDIYLEYCICYFAYLLLLDNILHTWVSLFMLNLTLLRGFHASCSSVRRMGASTL